MTHTTTTRIAVGFLLAGVITVAAMVLAPSPVRAIEFHPAPNLAEIPAFGSPKPESPRARAGFDPQPDPPKVVAPGATR